MRWIKRILLGMLSLVTIAVVLLMATGNTHVLYGVGKTYFIGKTKPDIDDLRYFDVSTIATGEYEAWPVARAFNAVEPSAFLSAIDSMETTALLVIHRDSLLYEHYWRGYTDSTLSNSFSMAKSFMAMLIGIAVQEGSIKSLNEPLGKYVPQYASGPDTALTLRHLLQMSSGIPFGESYNSPFGYMAKAYYGKNLERETLKYHVEKKPGSLWAYEGGNSVLLGMALRKATGMSASEYFSQKIWSRIGAQYPAHWNLDHAGGLEKTFSGFYATARDFARIGKLYLRNGLHRGDTIVPPDFVHQCLEPNLIADVNGEPCTWYGLHWWLGGHKGKKFFSCRGLRGQYIMVLPEEELIIVRLGHRQSADRVNHFPPDMELYMDAALSLIQHD